jgi:hypothetical protein
VVTSKYQLASSLYQVPIFLSKVIPSHSTIISGLYLYIVKRTPPFFDRNMQDICTSEHLARHNQSLGFFLILLLEKLGVHCCERIYHTMETLKISM